MLTCLVDSFDGFINDKRSPIFHSTGHNNNNTRQKKNDENDDEEDVVCVFPHHLSLDNDDDDDKGGGEREKKNRWPDYRRYDDRSKKKNENRFKL